MGGFASRPRHSRVEAVEAQATAAVPWQSVLCRALCLVPCPCPCSASASAAEGSVEGFWVASDDPKESPAIAWHRLSSSPKVVDPLSSADRRCSPATFVHIGRRNWPCGCVASCKCHTSSQCSQRSWSPSRRVCGVEAQDRGCGVEPGRCRAWSTGRSSGSEVLDGANAKPDVQPLFVGDFVCADWEELRLSPQSARSKRPKSKSLKPKNNARTMKIWKHLLIHNKGKEVQQVV